MKRANYRIEASSSTHILLRDLGPWDQHPTITNDAEAVVEDLAAILPGRKLYYIDSTGETGELLVKHGQFAGFSYGGPKKSKVGGCTASLAEMKKCGEDPREPMCDSCLFNRYARTSTECG